MEKKFMQVITCYDKSKFKPIPSKAKAPLEIRYEIFRKNMWCMFDVPKDSKQRNLSVTDFAWTEHAKKQFYDDPINKKFVAEQSKNSVSWSLTLLNLEPADLKDNEPYEIVSVGRYENSK